MRREHRILAFAFFLALALGVRAESRAVLQALRVGKTSERTRIVLEWDHPVSYELFEKKGESLLLVISSSRAPNRFLKPFVLPGPYLDHLVIFPVQKSSQKELWVRIVFRHMAPYRLFVLSNPFRLVLDVPMSFDRKEYSPLSKGVLAVHWEKGTPVGPVQMYGAILDLHRAKLQLVLPNAFLRKKESVRQMAEEGRLVAAINGSYFSPNGTPLGFLGIDGEVWTESLYHRTALFVEKEKVRLAEAPAKISFLLDGKEYSIDGVNRGRGNAEIVLYTPRFGKTTQTNPFGREWVIQKGIVTALVEGGNAAIPEDGVVLSFQKDAPELKVQVGSKVDLKLPSFHGWILQAGPKILSEGVVQVQGEEEHFKPDVLLGRAPRSVVGLKGEFLYLLAIAGRSSESLGATLSEAAEYLKELGAADGMNLDGGKSSQIYLKGVFEAPGIPVPVALGVRAEESK